MGTITPTTMTTSTYFHPRFLTRLFCTILLVSLCLPTAMAANNKKKNKNRGPSSKKGAASELQTIDSVSKDRIVVNGKIYYLGDRVKITVNGEEAKISQVKAGMQVMVSGKILIFGKGGEKNTYQANRIVARTNNKLAEKAKAANKKAAEAAKKRNQKNNKKNKNK